MNDKVNGTPQTPKLELTYVNDPDAPVGFAAKKGPIAVLRLDGQQFAVFGMASAAAQFVCGPDALAALNDLLQVLYQPKGTKTAQQKRFGDKRLEAAIQRGVATMQRFELMRRQPIPQVIAKEPPKLIVPG